MNHNEICADNKHESYIAEVFDETDNWRANARLLAKAWMIPHLEETNAELLECLKATLAHAEDRTCEIEDTDDLSEFPYIQKARAAIATAEGRA
jgi:hypothetical protein